MRTRAVKVTFLISVAALLAVAAPATPRVESAGIDPTAGFTSDLAGPASHRSIVPAGGGLREEARRRETQAAPITPADYGRWESLGGGELSPDGGWLAVSIRRVDGTGELQLHELAAAGGEPVAIENGARPMFSSDSAWLAYQIGFSEDEQERLREEDEPIRNKMGLRNLASGEAEVFEAVAGFGFADGGRFLAIRGYTPEEAEAADLIVRSLASGSSINFGNIAEYAWQGEGTLLAMTVATSGGAGNGVQVYDAATGVLRVLDSGDATFEGATWREDADDLAVLRSIEDEAHEEPTHLLLAWRGLEAALGGGAVAAATPAARLRFDHREAAGFPAGMRVVEHRAPQWSDDGRAIFFGIREWPEKPATGEEADESGAEGAQDAAGGESGGAAGAGGQAAGGQGLVGQDEGGTGGQQEATEDDEPEPADVDVWHARDERIIPMQKLQEQRDRSRSYLSVWHVNEDRFVRLGGDVDESIGVLAGDRHATETDRKPYMFDGMFGRRWFDVDLIDVATGERTGVVDRVRYFSGGSADGRYLLYFKDDHHFAYEIASGEHRNLTAALPSSFVDDEYDYPTEQKPPWGVGGWAKGDAAVLLYDRYDVWSVAPDGSGAARITNGAAEEIEHRVIRLGREEDFIDPAQPLWLDLYGRWTKKYGYARLDPPAGGGSARAAGGDTVRAAGGDSNRATGGDGASGPGLAPGGFSPAGPVRLLFVDKNAGGLAKADDAATFAYTLQGFDDSPDYFVGGRDLAGARQVTRTNPFQADFAWGRSRLIDYDCEFGPRVQGALFYPAGYEEGRRYPMITYVYELRSATVHNYSVPSARSPYNPAVWTSLGYFVLEPDIVYRDRMPGTSAVECVRPALKAVVETGMVDGERVGLVGHSWGGYEAAYIPTRTDIFAASVSGAALTNFFSMFGTIHWNQGLPESSHFETGQARMGVPYWEDMEAYMRESPVMGIPDLQTPMLMAFGDSDGTVDWHQGVEMYNYARRAGKQFVMLVYAGENHSNREKKNQLDYHQRILDWFGHYLKGEEAKPWIIEGTSVIERNDELRRRGDGERGGGRGGRGGRGGSDSFAPEPQGSPAPVPGR